jgi:predicted nucleotidyltransferase
MDPSEILPLCLNVMELHDGHTAILYGSLARGDATPESDVDLLCVRDGGPQVRDARLVNGTYLDAFVYPESTFATLEPSLLRILGGVVVRERDGFGSALLRVRELHERGPVAMPDDERQALVVWSQKMLDRFRKPRDVEIDCRRMYLLVRALEDYFLLRNVWYRGEKEAFAWLRQHDATAYASFESAGRSGASETTLVELVRLVYGTA